MSRSFSTPRTIRACFGGAVLALGVLSGVACDTAELAQVRLPPAVESQGDSAVIAAGGPDRVVLEGDTVTLSGTLSRATHGAPELTWTQLGGPSVLLTSATEGVASFRAPAAPARLRFALRARLGDQVDVDEVFVDVSSTASRPTTGVFDIPADRPVQPGDDVLLRLTSAGAPRGTAVHASTSCSNTAVTVSGLSASLRAPTALPCAVYVEAFAPSGRSYGRDAVVLWPSSHAPVGTPAHALPARAEPGTQLALPVSLDDTGVALVEYGGGHLSLDGARAQLTLPSRAGTVQLVLAARRAHTLGARRHVSIQVDGPGSNHAPTVDAAPARSVPPGALFAFAGLSARDPDGDATSIVVKQVLGQTARPHEDLAAHFVAPDTPGELVFHASATDGMAEGPPRPVRIMVDADSTNAPPTLPALTDMWVRPGHDFIVDLSGARDPDTGVAPRTELRQHEADPERVLAGAAPGPTVSLTAGSAHATYRLIATACDTNDECVSRPFDVHVEPAGPWVDPASTAEAPTGTPDAPFPTISAALDVARRHALPALHLVEGTHVHTGALPPDLGLRGGYVASDAGYTRDGSTTILELSGAQTLANTHLSSLVVHHRDAPRLHLEGASSFFDVAYHMFGATQAIQVSTNSAIRLEQTHITFDASGAHEQAIRVAPGGSLTGTQLSIRDQQRDVHTATAIGCDGGRVSLEASLLHVAASKQATGISAQNCTIDVADTNLEATAQLRATGLLLTASSVRVDARASLHATTSGAEGAATAIELVECAQPASISGALHAEGDTAVALRSTNSPVSVRDATLSAVGSLASTLRTFHQTQLQLVATHLMVRAARRGALLEGPDAVGSATFSGVTSTVEGPVVRAIDIPMLHFGTADTHLDVPGSEVVITADAVTLERTTARGAHFAVQTLGTAPSTVHQSTLQATFAGANLAGPTLFENTIISARTAIEATRAVTLHFCTIKGDTGVHQIAAETSTRALGTAFWTNVVIRADFDAGPSFEHCAFEPDAVRSTLNQSIPLAESASNVAPLFLEMSEALDADLRLLNAESRLIDQVNADTPATDIEGDARTDGLLDIGADEWAP